MTSMCSSLSLAGASVSTSKTYGHISGTSYDGIALLQVLDDFNEIVPVT